MASKRSVKRPAKANVSQKPETAKTMPNGKRTSASKSARPKICETSKPDVVLVRPPNVCFAPPLLLQKSSFELMRITTMAAISQIAYARVLFPGLLLEPRYFDPSEAGISYDTFINRTETTEGSPYIERLQTLPRGQIGAVDKLVDWIEIGVSDALQKGFLKKCQIAIHQPGGISFASLIESYTIVFTYRNGDVYATTQSARNENGDKTMLIADARQRLHHLMGNLKEELGVNKHMKPLPSKCGITMNLEYNDKAGPDYRPPGFKKGTDSTLATLNSGSSDERLTMKTGFHSISLGWNVEETDWTSCRSMLSDQLPTRFVCRNRSAGHSHISSSTFGDSTQQDALKALGAMCNSRQPDTQDTQLLQVSLPKMPQGSRLLKTTELNDLGVKLPYHEAIKTSIMEVHERQAYANVDKDLDEPQLSPDVLCECNTRIADELMLKCKLCRNLQHHPCYGYLYPQAGDHVCYTCLFKMIEDGAHRLAQMASFCTQRRMMYYLRSNNPLTSLEDLSEYMNVDIDSISAELAQLEKCKYIIPVPGVKSIGKSREGKPIYDFAINEATLCEKYFHPELAISDLLEYSPPENGMSQSPHNSASLRGPPINPSTQSSGGQILRRERVKIIAVDAHKDTQSINDSTTEDTVSPRSDKSSFGIFSIQRRPKRPQGKVIAAMNNYETPGRKRKDMNNVEDSPKRHRIWNGAEANSPQTLDRTDCHL